MAQFWRLAQPELYMCCLLVQICRSAFSELNPGGIQPWRKNRYIRRGSGMGASIPIPPVYNAVFAFSLPQLPTAPSAPAQPLQHPRLGVRCHSLNFSCYSTQSPDPHGYHSQLPALLQWAVFIHRFRIHTFQTHNCKNHREPPGPNQQLAPVAYRGPWIATS